MFTFRSGHNHHIIIQNLNSTCNFKLIALSKQNGTGIKELQSEV